MARICAAQVAAARKAAKPTVFGHAEQPVGPVALLRNAVRKDIFVAYERA